MRNIIYKGFVIEPSVELVPNITISPFCKGFGSDNISVRSNKNKSRLELIYRGGVLYPKCRFAINAALSYYNLKPDDVVSIFTTSGNSYISSCVTKEIEKNCRWSMRIESETKVILVNHEFGYPYRNIESLAKYGFPIIEDAAHAFFTKDENIGKIGDFVVYSLPKVFPMQLGGILFSPKGLNVIDDKEMPPDLAAYIATKYFIASNNVSEIIRKQVGNYSYLKDKLGLLGITPFFSEYEISFEKVVPSVFLFKWYDFIDYPKLKDYMQSNGVESSVFYGENAFFIPCNGFLGENELDYMIALLEYFFIENYENK